MIYKINRKDSSSLYLSDANFGLVERVDAQRREIEALGGRDGPLVRDDPVSFVLHGLLAHARPEALLQAAEPALVPLVLVDDARPLEPTRVHVALAHAPPKEALASVARVGAIVPPGGSVAAHRAHQRATARTSRLGRVDGRRRRRRHIAAQTSQRVSGRGGSVGQRRGVVRVVGARAQRPVQARVVHGGLEEQQLGVVDVRAARTATATTSALVVGVGLAFHVGLWLRAEAFLFLCGGGGVLRLAVRGRGVEAAVRAEQTVVGGWLLLLGVEAEAAYGVQGLQRAARVRGG